MGNEERNANGEGLIDEGRKANQESTTKNANTNSQEKKKHTHWSGVQMQGFQMHTLTSLKNLSMVK